MGKYTSMVLFFNMGCRGVLENGAQAWRHVPRKLQILPTYRMTSLLSQYIGSKQETVKADRLELSFQQQA